jgi:hypothetical protein
MPIIISLNVAALEGAFSHKKTASDGNLIFVLPLQFNLPFSIA